MSDNVRGQNTNGSRSSNRNIRGENAGDQGPESDRHHDANRRDLEMEKAPLRGIKATGRNSRQIQKDFMSCEFDGQLSDE